MTNRGPQAKGDRSRRLMAAKAVSQHGGPVLFTQPISASLAHCRASRRRSLDGTDSGRSPSAAGMRLPAPFQPFPLGTHDGEGWVDCRPSTIVWRTVRSRQKGGSSKEPRAGGSNPLLRREQRMPLVLTPLGSDQTSLHASPDRRHLFASAGALDPSRVGSATGRAYRSWRRRPPSSCPPRLASPSSRRLFSPL